MSMRRITLDYAAQARRPLFSWVALAGGALLLALAADGYADLTDEAERLDAQVDRLKRQMAASQTAKGRSDQAARERGQQRERDLLGAAAGDEWTAPLSAIELALDKDVALVSLSQETAGRHVRIGLEARRIEDALAFAERLRASGVFEDVVLTNHEIKKSTGIEVYGLSLVLTWKAAA